METVTVGKFRFPLHDAAILAEHLHHTCNTAPALLIYPPVSRPNPTDPRVAVKAAENGACGVNDADGNATCD